MGVKKSLATMIEGESLMNDGTAMVVYSVFIMAVEAGGMRPWLSGKGEDGGYVVTYAITMFCGCLWGVVFGWVGVMWLQQNKHVDRDANVEITVTLAMPFLVYYSAETAFGADGVMSGVLAVVFFGLVFAHPFGRTKLDPATEHFLHEFWGMVRVAHTPHMATLTPELAPAWLPHGRWATWSTQSSSRSRGS